ncbi:MAG: hypothetical protein AAF790_03835 [Planctomycetota bacterium]
MNRCRRVLPPALLLGVCGAVLAGCSEMTAQVGGAVLLDGKRMSLSDSQRGMVVFRPIAGGPTCNGLIEADGAYTIATGSAAALAPGEYLVSVRVMELVEPAAEGEAPTGRPITPAVYGDPLTSGLSCIVKSGANRYDIELKSSAGPAEVASPASDSDIAQRAAGAADDPDGQGAEPAAAEQPPAGGDSTDAPDQPPAPDESAAASEQQEQDDAQP